MPRSRRRRPTTYFIDADLAGHRFLETLRNAGIDFVSIHDVLPRVAQEASVKDPEWIALSGERGWVAVTKDHQLRKSWQEEVFAARARVFILRGSPHSVLAENFVASISGLERYLRRTTGPFIAKLHLPSKKERETKRKPKGCVETWMSYEQWLEVKGRKEPDEA